MMHNWKVSICKAVDSIDIMVLTPTGSRKTGYLTMYMLLMISLASNPKLVAPSMKKVHQNPVMVLVFLTNGVEEEMVCCLQLLTKTYAKSWIYIGA